MTKSKLLVGSMFTAAFLAAGVASAETTPAAPTPGKCYTGFEKLNRFVETIADVCGAGGTAQTAVGTIGGETVTGADAYTKASTVVAACKAVASAYKSAVSLEFFGPKSMSLSANPSADGHTFLFGDRAYYVDSELATTRIDVTINRRTDIVAKGKNKGKQVVSAGSAKLKVCVSNASSMKDFTARKDAVCDCTQVVLGKNDSSVTATIADREGFSLAKKKLFVLVNGTSASLKYTVTVKKAEAPAAASTTKPTAVAGAAVAATPAPAPAPTPAASTTPTTTGQ